MSLPILTESRLKDARACQRLHEFRYNLGYRPAVDADTLRFGSLIHRGLEAWWLGKADARLDEAIAALMDGKAADPFELVRAQAMLTGYHFRWKDEPYDVLGVEREFSTPLRNPETGQPSRTWTLGGKIDAVVRDRRDGRVLIVEHKTASGDIGQGSEYWKRLRMDGQVSVYYEGATALGFDVAGCLYDVLGKPALRQLKANSKRAQDETPEEHRERVMASIAEDPAKFFQRGEVVRLEIEMQEALHDIWQTARQIREAQLAHRAPRNPDACVRYGRTCAFFGVCTGEESLDDPTKFTRSTDVHPELAGTVDSHSKEESAQ